MANAVKRGKVYYAVFEGPPKPNGDRNQVWRSCKGMNKKETLAYANEEERKVRLGTFIAHDQALSAYFRDWLTQIEGTLAATTLSFYRIVVETHLIPEFGNTDIGKLTPLQIQKLYQRLLKTLAPKTVKNIHGTLHRALEQAVRWRLLTTNPADAVEPPKVVRRQISIAEDGQLAHVLNALKGREWYLPTLITLATGMRRAEVLGLQWQDFDEKQRVLIVRRSLVRITDKEIIEKDTKSGRVRIVAIPDALAQELLTHKAQFANTSPTDWICAKKDGGHLPPGGLSQAFHRAAKKLGYPLSFHSIRHTQATMLHMAGVPAKVVSERLGHATTQITQDTYAHVSQHMQRGAADLVGQTFFGEKREEGEGNSNPPLANR